MLGLVNSLVSSAISRAVEAVKNKSSSGTNSSNNSSSKNRTPIASSVNPLTGKNNNNYYNGLGYAYVDKHGFSHVVNDYKTAVQYAAPNTEIYEYYGAYGGGYAKDAYGNRVAVDIPGVQPYSNSPTNYVGLENYPVYDTFNLGSGASNISYDDYVNYFQNVNNKNNSTFTPTVDRSNVVTNQEKDLISDSSNINTNKATGGTKYSNNKQINSYLDSVLWKASDKIY